MQKHISGKNGFTLTELLVVISVIALLAALLAPAMATSRADSAAVKCMSNHRQLVTAWLMYASLNGNRLPPNQNGGGVQDLVPTWCEGWLEWDANWQQNTNWHNLVDSQAPNGTPASLGPYLGGSAQVFKCPEDVFDCLEEKQMVPRDRSISMNAFVEGGAFSTTGKSTWYPTWRAYNTVSDLTHPSPANLMVTLDEHPDSINDAWFITDVEDTTTWEDIPGSYHNGAASLSFADGHCELHHWQGMTLRQPVKGIYINGTLSDTPGNVDIAWVTNHCSERITGE
jgi:prepilin-type N-terminal cleavage/methylation domain-containing protein/prepilin-type processing-associated H-X9-DG protein